MSDPSGEIIFGEMEFREPVRLRRPDRDPAKTCIAYGTPAPAELPIFLAIGPADAIERHALSDTSVELGGVLLGKECVDDETGEPFVWITESLQARNYQNTQASFTYTHESWEIISRERDEKFPDLDIVGWYHTHPDFGIFLSSHDLFIHEHFFAQPLQVAYVVDPIRQTRGFFQWHEGALAPLRGFWIAGDRRERAAIARLVNDLEGQPAAEGVGSGLSPILEAELIAMLNRPQHPMPPPTSPATSGVVGAFVGMLALALFLWLYQIHDDLKDQAAGLEAVAATQQATNKRLAESREVEVPDSKERALDAILALVDPGDPPEAQRDRLVASMDDSLRLQTQIDQLQTDKQALGVLIAQIRDRAADLNRRRDRSAKDAADARTRLKAADDKISELRDELAIRESSIRDGETGALLSRNNLTFWAAIGGWLAFALAVTGLVMVATRGKPDDPGVDLGIPRGPFTAGSTPIDDRAADRPEPIPPHRIQ